MQELASLFVALVTFSSTFVPGVKTAKLLSLNPLNPAAQVLSETDVNESGASATLKPTDASDRKSLIMQKLEANRLERQQKLETFRQKRQTNTEERQAKRTEFAEKLADISDERKQEVVENIDEQLATLNSKWIGQWNKTLERLSGILVKIETRSQVASENGKDISEITAKIDDAEAAIAKAQEAVNAQSEKTYTVTITTEANLGQDVRTTINTFHNDIKNTKDVVAEAKKAVVAVFQTLKTIVVEDKEDATE